MAGNDSRFENHGLSQINIVNCWKKPIRPLIIKINTINEYNKKKIKMTDKFFPFPLLLVHGLRSVAAIILKEP